MIINGFIINFSSQSNVWNNIKTSLITDFRLDNQDCNFKLSWYECKMMASWESLVNEGGPNQGTAILNVCWQVAMPDF
jgi:hypothetical protein